MGQLLSFESIVFAEESLRIVKSSGKWINIMNENCEFDLQKLKTSTLNKLGHAKRMLISKVRFKQARNETVGRSLDYDVKRAADCLV